MALIVIVTLPAVMLLASKIAVSCGNGNVGVIGVLPPLVVNQFVPLQATELAVFM